MYIRVAENGELGLQDSDDFRAFAIVRAGRAAPLVRLAEIATTAEDNHYWLDADVIEELSGRKHDQQWVKDFRAMLASVAPYGYYDTTNNKVKAHVESSDD